MMAWRHVVRSKRPQQSRGQQRQVRRVLAVPARAPALLPDTATQVVPVLGTQASLGLPSFHLISVEVAGSPGEGVGEILMKGWGPGREALGLGM